MEFGHDTTCALGVVAELVNTSEELTGEEKLPDLGALRDFVTSQGMSEVGRITRDDLPPVRDVRRRFYEVWTASDQQQAVDRVNAIIADAGTTPRLTNHDGYGWHIHYFTLGAPLARRLAADGGMALAFVLAADERERLRVCEAPDCLHVFIDLSRNRCRRYCDSRSCGNRLHVAAYRARKAAAS